MGWEILYFDGDIIRKCIVIRENFYREESLYEVTRNNRKILAPKTNRGKEVKLTKANLDKRTRKGTYFLFSGDSILIANYSTQKTYYDSKMASVKCNSFSELSVWLKNWINNTTEEYLEEIKLFSSSKREHCKYKEGDFFRFRIDRGLYGFGRILLNYHRLRKEKIKFWDILFGIPLVVKVYHIISSDPNIPITKLKTLKAIPSQFIMDNIFYYGKCEIIGHEKLNDNELDFPIMNGRSIDFKDLDKIIFQQGLVYKTIPYENGKVLGRFRSGIWFNLNVNREILQKCIDCNSNDPYWNRDIKYLKEDLSNPMNKEMYKLVLKQFNLDEIY